MASSSTSSVPTPGDHLGYGVRPPHFCLSDNLARRKLTTMVHALFRLLSDLEARTE
jgi:cytochrome P450